MLDWSVALAAVLQVVPAACPAGPAALPAELAGWRDAAPVTAGRTSAGAPFIAVGRGARATLHPAARVALPVRPAKAGPGAHGGVLAFDAARAGRYRVALGSPGWLEVVRDGRAIGSAAHAHGPSCSGVRKMVDFDLRPGRHILEIAGAADATATVLVTYIG